MRVRMNPREYGKPPFQLAVVHGGPGAPGEMAPVARELSQYGVVEPLQTKDSVGGQVEELKKLIDTPIVLGWSWGAWLSLIYAATYPDSVKKLIMVSSGPFEERYAAGIMRTRLSRLSTEERERLDILMKSLEKPEDMKEFGSLMSKADSFAPVALDKGMDFEPRIFEKVWAEASQLRKSGRLISYAEKVRCSVIAIHGNYDPHPADGVRMLSDHIRDFRFILLEKCGHTPWNEKYARERFFKVVRGEIGKELIRSDPPLFQQKS